MSERGNLSLKNATGRAKRVTCKEVQQVAPGGVIYRNLRLEAKPAAMRAVVPARSVLYKGNTAVSCSRRQKIS